MKIYFSFSLSSLNKTTKDNCTNIASIIKNEEYTLVCDDLDKKLKFEDYYKNQSEEESFNLQKKLIKQKNTADILIFEVSNKSIGIGQEIAYGVSIDKPIILLYTEGNNPHIIATEKNDLLIKVEYNKYNLKKLLLDAIKEASKNSKVRFNIILTNKMYQYLNEKSKENNLTKASFIRNLLLAHKNTNK